MIREDYIIRMIDQLVKVLLKILINKKNKNYQEAIHTIDTAFDSILGLDFNIINLLTAQDLISLLNFSSDEEEKNIKCIVIAKLLKERVEIERVTDTSNSKYVRDYQKALYLYLEGILNNDNLDIDTSNYFADVTEIIEKLGDKVTKELKLGIKNFYELNSQFDKANGKKSS